MIASRLIEVAFKGNRKDFFLWANDDVPPPRTAVIVDADRGEDLGYVHAVRELAEKRNAGTPHGYGKAGTAKRARRAATADEIQHASTLRDEDEDARQRAMERVRANDLAMKLTDAEWQWDRKKLTFYFTAERRVDFRTLVRELASMFRTRIELKQIGVRDEAKRLDGIGRCGRQYCSASWLPELRPVNLGVAKDQRLSLNPSQISGACGRLMCCLRYEHEFYVQSRKRFPKEGRIVRTAKGESKIIANDIFRDRVTLRDEDGECRTILLAEYREETSNPGTVAAEVVAAISVIGAGELAAVQEPDPVAPEGPAERLEKPSPEQPPEKLRRSPRPIRTELTTEDSRLSVAETADEANGADEATGGDEVNGEDEANDSNDPDNAEQQERRPHRRRGRRGGRRNRSGGQSGSARPSNTESEAGES